MRNFSAEYPGRLVTLLSCLPRNWWFWVFRVCVRLKLPLPEVLLWFWGERFMPRGRGAMLSRVLGNSAYAKPLVPRHGIKLVAQNREGEKASSEASGRRGLEAPRVRLLFRSTSSFSSGNPRFWGNDTCPQSDRADPGLSVRYWGERFMPRGRGAMLSRVLGSSAYAKPPVPRHGIKLVAQNHRGAQRGAGGGRSVDARRAQWQA